MNTPETPNLMYATLKQLQSQPNTQVINHRINLRKLTNNESCMYFNQLRFDISRQIQYGKQVFINFITQSKTTEKWILETLLTLQHELTPHILISKRLYEQHDIDEWTNTFNPETIVIIKN
jgi:hypothetical protein